MLKSIQSNYTIPDIYPVDARGTTYTFGFFSAKHPGAGQFYLLDIKDKDGQRLNEASTYKLTVPANAPVTQYWSATLYDAETHALIRNMSRASRSSQNPDLKKNADGSVDLYFGSKAPAGQDSNWVPTDVNGRFEVLFRLYGPERLSSTKHGCCPTSRRYSSKAHTEPHLARWTSPRKCACNG